MAVPLDEQSKSPILRKASERLPKILRENDPEYGLLVWCSWRLSRAGRPLATSRTYEANSSPHPLDGLVARRIIGIKTLNRFYDLEIRFNGGWQLDIHCDRGEMTPSTATTQHDSNWEIFVPGDFVVGV